MEPKLSETRCGLFCPRCGMIDIQRPNEATPNSCFVCASKMRSCVLCIKED